MWVLDLNLPDVVQVAIGVVTGGLITGFFAWRSAKRVEERFQVLDDNIQESFEITARFLETYAQVTLDDDSIEIGFSRDEDGRIENAEVTLHVGPVADLEQDNWGKTESEGESASQE